MRAKWSFSRCLHGICRNEAGNIATIFGITAIPLLAALGGGVDLLSVNRHKGEMQAALDAATLAGVTRSIVQDEQISAANDYFAANFPGIAQLTSFNFEHSGEAVTGTATMDVGTSFLNLVGISEIATSARSAATREVYREPLCFMAMHPTRKHTLELKDSVSVLAPDCNVYGNSNHPDDVVDPHNAANFLTGKSVQAIGYGHNYLQNVTPPLARAVELIPDPLASLAIPTATLAPTPTPVAGCNYGGSNNPQKDVNGGTITLIPGVYCKGLKIRNNANVTLSAGTYYIKTGAFTIDEATVTGSNVKIVLLDSQAKLDWKNNSTIRLSGETAGTYAGIVMLGSATVAAAATHQIDSCTVDLHGVVYLPKGEFVWKNTGTPVVNAKWTAWIVDGISWEGTGVVKINFQPKNSSVPYPDALTRVIPLPGKPRLVY